MDDFNECTAVTVVIGGIELAAANYIPKCSVEVPETDVIHTNVTPFLVLFVRHKSKAVACTFDTFCFYLCFLFHQFIFLGNAGIFCFVSIHFEPIQQRKYTRASLPLFFFSNEVLNQTH